MDSSLSLAIVNRALAGALARQAGIVITPGPPGPETTHVIRNMYPPRLDPGAPGALTFFYFAWEDSRIPSAWAQAFNRHFDGLLVPSTHVRDVVRRSGVAIPVAVVPYGVEVGPEPVTAQPPVAPTRGAFRFLHVSTGFPRKGCDVLVRAFTREFSAADDVALVIKTLPQYDHPTARLVRRARWLRWRGPEVVHVDEDMDAATLGRLYASASCLVHPARAEGFGLPIAEAMLAGIPVIASDYSGHTDFCTNETAILVPCRPARSRSPFIVEDAEWGEPDELALRQALRHVFEHRHDPLIATRAARAAAHVRTFTWDRAARRAIAFMGALDDAASAPIRAGMLTTWRERCGIAEYSRQLIAAIDDPAISWTIVAPLRGDRTTRESALLPAEAEPPVIRCWRDDWPLDIGPAVAHARALDLGVVHVQAHLNTWTGSTAGPLTGLASEGRRVFVTLHSVRGSRPDETLVRALRTLDRLFVHTDGDRARLAAMGIDGNVTVLPQGYPPAPDDEPVEAARRRLGVVGDPVIGTYGFLRPHKGVVELIRAIGRLRRRYPHASLLAVTALYPSDDSAEYLVRCRREADRQGLADRCHFVTDFLDSAASLSALRACDVVALPYLPTIDSSSAAVRMALASRRPVVTTDVPVFADVRDAVVTVRRRTPRLLAAGLRCVLEDGTLRDRLAARAARHLDEQSWSAVGAIYRKVLRTAVMDLTSYQTPYPVAAPS